MKCHIATIIFLASLLGCQGTVLNVDINNHTDSDVPEPTTVRNDPDSTATDITSIPPTTDKPNTSTPVNPTNKTTVTPIPTQSTTVTPTTTPPTAPPTPIPPIPTTTKGTTTTVKPSPTTLHPDSTPHPTSTSTKVPPTSAPSRSFDGPSFIGGMVLASGLMAISFIAFKFYKARTERNYHTL